MSLAPDPGPGFRSNQLGGESLAAGEPESVPAHIQEAANEILHWCGEGSCALDLMIEKFQTFDLAAHRAFVPLLRELTEDEVKRAIRVAEEIVNPPRPQLDNSVPVAPVAQAGLASPGFRL